MESNEPYEWLYARSYVGEWLIDTVSSCLCQVMHCEGSETDWPSPWVHRTINSRSFNTTKNITLDMTNWTHPQKMMYFYSKLSTMKYQHCHCRGLLYIDMAEGFVFIAVYIKWSLALRNEDTTTARRIGHKINYCRISLKVFFIVI